MESFTNSRKFQLSYKLCLTMACLSGLIYQINTLLTDYLGGETLVTLNVGRFDQDHVPGLTLCFEDINSLRSSMSLDIQKANQNYSEMRKNLYKYQQQDLTQNISEAIKTTQRKMAEIRNDMLSQIYLSPRSISDIMSEYRLGLEQIKINISLSGTTYDEQSRKFVKISNVNVDKPTESVLILPISGSLPGRNKLYGINAFKCFTYFSAINKYWRKFKIKIDHMYVKISNMDILSPVYLSLHSPNSLSTKNPIMINFGESHDLYYTQLKTELLGDGYDTNCYNYDLDYIYANVNMRSDCLASCFQQARKLECDSGEPLHSDYLLKIDWIKQHKDWRFNKPSPCSFDTSEAINSECLKECRADCSFSYYILDIKTFKSLPGLIQISVMHTDLPDILIRHSPQMPFISFICNFGGLLGMWLGLSVLTIIDESLVKIIRLLTRPNYNFVNNFFITNTIRIPRVFIRKQRDRLMSIVYR